MDRTIYQEMYLHLFNAVTDALRKLEQAEVISAIRILANAQLDTEEMYVNRDDADVKQP